MMIEEQNDDSGSVRLPFGKQTVVGSTGKLFDVQTTYNRINTADVVFTPEYA